MPTVAERATGCNRLRQAGQSETAIDESLRVGHTKTKKKKKKRTHKCVRLMSIVNVSGNRRKPNNSSKAICDSYCCSCTHTHTATHCRIIRLALHLALPRSIWLSRLQYCVYLLDTQIQLMAQLSCQCPLLFAINTNSSAISVRVCL